MAVERTRIRTQEPDSRPLGRLRPRREWLDQDTRQQVQQEAAAVHAEGQSWEARASRSSARRASQEAHGRSLPQGADVRERPTGLPEPGKQHTQGHWN